jgi:hypothetical protein
MRALLAASVLTAALSLAGPATPRDQVPAETRDIPWKGVLPDCNDIWVLSFVSDHFADKESYYWNSSLKITQYDHIQSLGYRQWGLEYIPRRFCTAKALLSDGIWRTVNYSVREALGYIGGTWGVEFCVVGLDRNLAYAPECKMAAP